MTEESPKLMTKVVDMESDRPFAEMPMDVLIPLFMAIQLEVLTRLEDEGSLATRN